MRLGGGDDAVKHNKRTKADVVIDHLPEATTPCSTPKLITMNKVLPGTSRLVDKFTQTV